jgi:serine protein kinase
MTSKKEVEATNDNAEDSVEVTTSNDNSDDFFGNYTSNYKQREQVSMSFTDYLNLCKDDKKAYANAAERLLDAIGEPEMVDTSKASDRLKNVHQGKIIARYKAFEDFFGMEDTIKKIVSHLKGAAAGDEYRKQVLFLLGPVGGGKSSLGDRIKELMEVNPIYVLKSKNPEDPECGELSPIYESPLGVFDGAEMKAKASERFGIPTRSMNMTMSPWATKRLELAGGNPDEAFEVVRVFPSVKNQIAVAKVEPQDDNTQDVSALVGKVNINELGEGLDQNDPDAYLYSGGFAHGNQGVMEFVEMLKTPLKVLNPMLEALQSRNYQGTESIGPIPFEGIVVAHTNESEFNKFFGNSDNEAIVDRMNVIHVPYTLQMTEEAKIYKKMINQSGYSDKPMAPKTIEILAKFAAMSRVMDVEGTEKYSHKIRAEVMDGDTPEGPAAKVPTIGELRKSVRAVAPTEEGMSGISTRFAFKTLTETFNSRANEGELGADPILLMETLENRIVEDGKISDANTEKYIGFITNDLMPEYGAFIAEEISEAFTNASDGMCQNMFDRYIAMANAWIMDDTFNDKAITGQVMGKEELDQKLREIEGPSNIPDAKAFRDMVTRYVMNQENQTGQKVKWDSYTKMKQVIRTNLSRKMQDVMPIIQFDGPALEGEEQAQRDTFLSNMEKKGYTLPMVKRAVGLYQKMSVS